MKIQIAVLAVLFAVAYAEDTCSTSINSACTTTGVVTPKVDCNSKYGGISHIEKEMQAYINAQLAKSYEYLLSATYFNSYQKDRPGFYKLFKGMSDEGFDDTIKLIKKLTQRGGVIDYTKNELPSGQIGKVEKDELAALAQALENEKALSSSAIHVHGFAVYRHKHSNDVQHPVTDNHVHDPDFAEFFEDEIITKQASSIRKLAGYTNDLFRLVNKNTDPSLAVHLFDQYLLKQ